MPAVRKQARGLARLLKKGGLPEHVQKQKEEQLRQLAAKAATNKRAERERHFSKKYHKVKFFERQKVEKRLAHLRRQLAEAKPSAQPALEKQITESEHDLLYVQHFPRHKKYLSLFPSANGDDPFVEKQRARIRAMIVRRNAEGGLVPKVWRGASGERGSCCDGEDGEAQDEDEEGEGLKDAFFADDEHADAEDGGGDNYEQPTSASRPLATGAKRKRYGADEAAPSKMNRL